MFSCPVTLNNFLRNESSLEDAIYTHPSGLRVVPASLKLGDIVEMDVNKLRDTIRQVFCNYDIVFLDSAPGLGREALIALQASDEILYVANPHIPSLVDIEKCKQVVSAMEYRPVTIGVLLNRVRNKNYEIKTEEIREFLDMPVIGVIPEDENILAGFNKKELVVLSKKNSKSSKNFVSVAAKLAGVSYEYGFFERIKRAFRKDSG